VRIGPAGIYFLFVVAVFLPYLAIRSYLKLKAGAPFPSRKQYLTQAYLLQVFFLVLSVLVARLYRMELFARHVPDAEPILAGLAFIALAAGTARARWRITPEDRRRRVYLLVPQTRREEFVWFVLCLLVGLSEEITYRGVLYGLLLLLVGEPAAAALLACIVFAANHAVQGWRSCVLVFCYAIVFHLLVWFSGSLYVAMAAHAAYDIIAGITFGRLGRAEFGTSAPVPVQAESA